MVNRTLRPIQLYVEAKIPTTLQGYDKIFELLATGTPDKAIQCATETENCTLTSLIPHNFYMLTGKLQPKKSS